MQRYSFKTGLVEGGTFLLGLLVLFPVYIVVINSVRSDTDYGNRLVPPTEPLFGNFADAWAQANLGQALMNSLIITVASVLVIVVVSATAAYPLARLTARWTRAAYLMFVLGLLLPFQLALIPLYTTLRDLGLLGNPLSLVILYAGLQAPFSIFLYTEFLRSIPQDYDEAAQLDGCSHLKLFVRVLFPMLAPITGTVVILNAVHVWNDFYAPLLYLSGSRVQTVPLAVYQFTGAYASQWGLIFSSLMLGSIPVLIAFLIMQKAVFRGYSSGLKG